MFQKEDTSAAEWLSVSMCAIGLYRLNLKTAFIKAYKEAAEVVEILKDKFVCNKE